MYHVEEVYKCECKCWNHNGTYISHLWEFGIHVLILSKNESEKLYLYVEGFRVFIFLFYFEVGRGVKKVCIYTGTSDFMMFRISFIWQLPVDYSALGVYMNMLFVVNSFTFSVNVNVNMYHLSQNVTCIYVYLVYRYIILFQMLSVHALVIK